MSDPEQLPEEAEEAEVAPTAAAEAGTTAQNEEPPPKPQVSIDTTDQCLSSREKFE